MIFQLPGSNLISNYLMNHFLKWFLIVLFALLAVVFLVDIIELGRRAASKEAIEGHIQIQLAALKIPLMIEKMLPFSCLIGAMIAFSSLAKRRELTVFKSSGVSVWQILTPVILVTICIGLFNIFIMKEVTSATTLKFQQLEDRFFEGRTGLLTKSGLWLKQPDVKGLSIVHAEKILPDPRFIQLQNVMILLFKEDNQFIARIDSDSAILDHKEGYWNLNEVSIVAPNKAPDFIDNYSFKTTLTPKKIQESFQSPETLTLLELPGFIEMMKSSGFPVIKHRLYFHSLLANPFLLCAMILIAAAFSMRLIRYQTRVTTIVIGGLFAGFLLYFLSDFVFALGVTTDLPIILAAWAPTIASASLGILSLMHFEEP